MSIVAIGMNLLLAGLLGAALVMGWRLNQRLKALRDSHDGFATAVRDLNAAAARAEQGLADLRAATDEATDQLADRIEKGRALASKLERLVADAPQASLSALAATHLEPPVDKAQERRLGALLAAAREARQRPERLVRSEPVARPKPSFEDELFEDQPLALTRTAR
jgi:hypothetical protein